MKQLSSIDVPHCKSVPSHGILRKKRSILFLRSTGAQETALGRYAKSVTTVTGRNGRAQGMA